MIEIEAPPVTLGSILHPADGFGMIRALRITSFSTKATDRLKPGRNMADVCAAALLIEDRPI
jgi:hypothetical protein